MRWLLQWGGVKIEKPWWDKWLLLLAALLVVVISLDVRYPSGWPAKDLSSVHRHSFCWGDFFLGIYFSSRQIERLQLKQTIENCRQGFTTGHVCRRCRAQAEARGFLATSNTDAQQ